MDFTEPLIRQPPIDASGTATISYQGRELDCQAVRAPDDHARRSGSTRRIATSKSTMPPCCAAIAESASKRRSAVPERRRRLHGPVRGNRRGEALAADLHHRVPDRNVAAGARADKTRAVTERFELYITGREFGNGFTELNDAEDQAARFKAQVAQRTAATKRRCSSTTTSCARSSTACRRPAAAASASTG